MHKHKSVGSKLFKNCNNISNDVSCRVMPNEYKKSLKIFLPNYEDRIQNKTTFNSANIGEKVKNFTQKKSLIKLTLCQRKQ